MGKILGMTNGKGGVGKTTTAVNLAKGVQIIEKIKVQIFDRDEENESARDHWEILKNPNNPKVLIMPAKINYRDIERAANLVDLTIIDCAANDKDVGSVILSCDRIIIPLKASYFDATASAKLLPLIQKRLEDTNGLAPKTAFLITMNEPGTLISKEIAGTIAEFGFPVLETRINKRVIYVKTIGEGLTVFDVDTKEARAAQDEIKSLIVELKERGFLNG